MRFTLVVPRVGWSFSAAARALSLAAAAAGAMGAAKGRASSSGCKFKLSLIEGGLHDRCGRACLRCHTAAAAVVGLAAVPAVLTTGVFVPAGVAFAAVFAAIETLPPDG